MCSPGIQFLRVVVGLVVVLAAAEPTDGQQAAFGDYVLTEAGTQTRGIIHVDPATSRLTHWPEPPAGDVMRAARMDRLSNASVLAIVPGSTVKRGYVVLSNTVANLTASTLTFGLQPVDVADGQDGGLLVLTSDGRLHRFYYYNTYTILLTAALPRTATALTVDGDTGDYIVATGGGLLLRVDSMSLAITTIAAGLGAVADVDFDPWSGGFVIATSAGPRLISRAGTLVQSFALANTAAVRVDPEQGRIHATGGDTIVGFARNGTALQTLRFPGYNFTSLERFGTAKVTGGGVARPGNQFFYTFWFGRAAANQPYFAAMSYSGLRPGITVAGGRRISLVPDPLFQLTASLGDLSRVTYGMQGTLQASGRGSLRIVLPASLPYGFRLWASAFVLDPSKPGGIDTANTIGFTMRPSNVP